MSGNIWMFSDGTVLINRDIFDAYLERFHELATGKGKEEIIDER